MQTANQQAPADSLTVGSISILAYMLEGTAARFAAERGATPEAIADLREICDTIEEMVHRADYESFERVHTFLPETAVTRRKRLDFADWYMGAMSDWCERWAIWAREALPNTVIHQSSGGWGPGSEPGESSSSTAP